MSKFKGLCSNFSRALPLAMLLSVVAVGCGEEAHLEKNNTSFLQWVKSRPDSNRYAFLRPEDFEDSFLLGISVNKVDGFLSSALNMTLPPQKVKLVKEEVEGQKKLKVKSETGEDFLAFDLAEGGEYGELDFASSGNDLKLRQIVDVVGGMFTASDRSGYWLSQGAPTVLNVSQDNDTVVVDLLHTVSQVKISRNPAGSYVVTDRVSQSPGKVTLRLWLKRQKALPALNNQLTVGEGKQLNLGYFSSKLMASADSSGEAMQIQRFPLQPVGPEKSVTFYLKDFPEKYIEVGKEAVLSWNKAFGYQALKVKVAPQNIDAGDPRYHVIKWFDNTDNDLGWAGVAKMIVDPDSGLVMSGSVYIQGNTLLNSYRKIVSYTHSASQGGIRRLEGSIGSVNLTESLGETPVIPYFTTPNMSFDDYMKGYYLETVAHEVGHVLGLRHNFKGSTQIDETGNPASIMDYLPRSNRHFFQGPGSYDIAAIRWGYFGEAPSTTQPFCADEQLWTLWDCHQSDYGDPINYVTHGLEDGATLLAQKPIKVEEQVWIATMASLVESAHKMWKLSEQLTPDNTQKVEGELRKAYKHLFDVKAASWLTPDESTIVNHNLDLVKSLAKRKVSQLKAMGRI